MKFKLTKENLAEALDVKVDAVIEALDCMSAEIYTFLEVEGEPVEDLEFITGEKVLKDKTLIFTNKRVFKEVKTTDIPSSAGEACED